MWWIGKTAFIYSTVTIKMQITCRLGFFSSSVKRKSVVCILTPWEFTGVIVHFTHYIRVTFCVTLRLDSGPLVSPCQPAGTVNQACLIDHMTTGERRYTNPNGRLWVNASRRSLTRRVERSGRGHHLVSMNQILLSIVKWKLSGVMSYSSQSFEQDDVIRLWASLDRHSYIYVREKLQLNLLFDVFQNSPSWIWWKKFKRSSLLVRCAGFHTSELALFRSDFLFLCVSLTLTDPPCLQLFSGVVHSEHSADALAWMLLRLGNASVGLFHTSNRLHPKCRAV